MTIIITLFFGLFAILAGLFALTSFASLLSSETGETDPMSLVGFLGGTTLSLAFIVIVIRSWL